MTEPVRLVVALGGNALSPGSSTGTVAEMRSVLAGTARPLADLVQRGAQLVLTHGNGPQVGRLLQQQALAAREVPPLPMDVCVAATQGEIGYVLAQALDAELRRRSLDRTVLCLVTQVVVDADDPAFDDPRKPVGPSGTARRLVASPSPRRIVEAAPLKQVVDAGHVVVVGGGGGVPVVDDGDVLRGVDAVVDKDLTASLVARLCEADGLLLLTDVPCVQVGYGTPRARGLSRLTVAEARELLDAGEFPPGSMGPKVRACCEFVEAGGRRAVIAALTDAERAAYGDAGTEVVAG